VLAYTYGYGDTPYPGGWAFSVFDTAGTGVGGRGAIGSVNDGNWHHLAHVFDRKAGVQTYLDGAPVGYEKQSGTSFQATADVDSGNPWTIGQDPTGLYAESGSGDIDDLGIWRRALKPLEVASIYMGAISNKLSFVNGVSAPVTIKLQKSGGATQLIWSEGTLQAADRVDGSFQDLSSASSPYTLTPTQGSRFFRVRQQ
jgi:hypothetical protein